MVTQVGEEKRKKGEKGRDSNTKKGFLETPNTSDIVKL